MAARDGKAATDRGAQLERRVGRLEFVNGSLVRLRHPVTQVLDGRRRDVTDIDVLSIDFDARLRTFAGITECKSVRGQAGEQDRLLWLRGLAQFVGANSGTLVRESVSAAGRDIARVLDLDLVAEEEISKREKLITGVPLSFASLGGAEHDEARKVATGQAKKIGDLPPGLVAFLRHDALLAPPHRVLGALVTLEEITRAGTVLPEPLAQLLMGDALVALVLAGLRTGHMTDTLSSSRIRSELETGIGAGDPGDRQLIRVAEMADQLLKAELVNLHRAYREAGAPPQDGRRVPSVVAAISQPPLWLEQFVDLAERLRRRSPISRSLPQTLDLLLFEEMLGGTLWKSPAFDHLFTREHRLLLMLAKDCLEEAVPSLAGRLDFRADVSFDRAPTPGMEADPRGAKAIESEQLEFPPG